MTQSTQSHPRYEILDGLRGVAAVMVVGYHLFEAIAFAAGASEQQMYHGFLAVDFFFILSGFVMGYAYDERWNQMSLTSFIRRRLIRLHPMVVIGVLIGLASFVFQGCVRWDGSQVGISLLMFSTLMALFLLPVPTSMDVRGNTEMFPLNGPHWSLFFEYIGSLVYGLLLHRLSTRCLKWWVLVAGAALFLNGFLGPQGDIAYGWSSEPYNMFGGLLRVSFGYPMGLLMARLYRERTPRPLGGPVFLWCSIVVVVLLSLPSVSHLGLMPDTMPYRLCRIGYQFFSLAIAFPMVLWMGARGSVRAGFSLGSARLLGRMSYPLYAVHYPFIYLYIHWINTDAHPFGPQWWATPLAVFLISLVVAYLAMRFYDEPLRRWLSQKYVK